METSPIELKENSIEPVSIKNRVAILITPTQH